MSSHSISISNNPINSSFPPLLFWVSVIPPMHNIPHTSFSIFGRWPSQHRYKFFREWLNPLLFFHLPTLKLRNHSEENEAFSFPYFSFHFIVWYCHTLFAQAFLAVFRYLPPEYWIFGYLSYACFQDPHFFVSAQPTLFFFHLPFPSVLLIWSPAVITELSGTIQVWSDFSDTFCKDKYLRTDHIFVQICWF